MKTPESILWDEAYVDKSAGSHRNIYPSDIVLRWINRPSYVQRKGLDLGCGWGNNLLPFLARGFNLVGVDCSKEAINYINSVSQGVAILASFANLPFEAESFDFAFDRCSIQHAISEELQEIFAEVHRVLKTGGEFFTEFNFERPQSKMLSHVSTKEEIEVLLCNVGFRILSIDTITRTEKGGKELFRAVEIKAEK